MRRGMEAISMWHGSGGMEAQVGFDNSLQVICIVGPSGSHLPLDNTPDYLWGSGQASLLANQAQ